jgi:pyruvate/2-oxoacid:ferredoxin oxidoreductase alpha subunit
MIAAEQRADTYCTDDAEILLVAATTPAQLSKGAVEELRGRGVKVGLFRPVTLWPFPIARLLPLLPQTKRLVIVEASNGQLEDEVRLALSHAGVHAPPPIGHIRHFGGVLPQVKEIVDAVLGGREVN